MWRRVWALLVKEFLVLLKDPKSRTLLFIAPVIQLVVFGYAATFDLNQVPIAVYDQAQSGASRDLIARFTLSPTFLQVATLHSTRRIPDLIDQRTVAMVLVIKHDFTRDLLLGRPAPVQLIIDGRNSNTALLVSGYASSIIANFSQSWLARHGGKPPSTAPVMRALYNPALLSRWFIVPGIVVMLTQVVGLLVVSLSVAREREAGTFDQLLVTPLRQIDILLGKGLPGMLIGILEASIIILAAVWWFAVPLRGSLLLLYLGLFLFVLAITGIGLMISSLARSQQQALLGAFLFMVPSVILSGFATPIANMPLLVQYLTFLNPTRYFLIVVRGVFLENAGMDTLASQFWPMALIGVACLLAAGWLFRARA